MEGPLGAVSGPFRWRRAALLLGPSAFPLPGILVDMTDDQNENANMVKGLSGGTGAARPTQNGPYGARAQPGALGSSTSDLNQSPSTQCICDLNHCGCGYRRELAFTH
jgi:hypothetical protein